MQIARVRVEQSHLLLPGFDDTRVAVPDMADVVDAIQISPPIFVVEVLHPAAHDLERVTVRDAEGFADMLRPQAADVLAAQTIAGKILGGHANDEVGIGTQAEPDLALAGARHAWEFAFFIEQVGDDLEMEMRRPVAIDGVGANPGDGRSSGDRLTFV